MKKIFCRHKWEFGKSPTFEDEWRNISTHYICKKCNKEAWQSYVNDKLWGEVTLNKLK